MFSIAAINDTDSKSTWEPLAPTKEAQEFHLTQNYHEGLQKLQAKEYDKARELLEAVLKDPMISSAQVESTAGDSHLLQLKFLALKNLASVFLQQGSDHHENALNCYLQAVEIDTKDSVVWNKLGTLACSMGILNISRWAFEQGLACSPNNWNCMEKLLEVLIAIGDEVACLSVAELILRHWPSHARALHVKRTIEDPEPVPFAPKGIDKLEPKHVRLTFGKRKAPDSNLEVGSSTKRVNHSIQLQLTELSWVAVASSILGILLRQDRCDSEKEDEIYNHSRNTRIEICLPSNCGDAENSTINCGQNNSVGECSSIEESNSIKKDAHYSEEQIHERRSSRLERMRSQKTGKEDREFSGVKDMEKVVIRFLQPFIISGQQDKDFDHSSDCSPVNEWLDVQIFVLRTSKNHGADHLGHMLLEEVANRDVAHSDGFRDFLELEKLTRLCGWDRTPECSLFLAELYHDFGSCLSDSSRMSDFLHEAVYHLAKIIESVLLDWPTGLGVKGGESGSVSSLERPKSFLEAPILTEKSSFWVRYYWLSGLVSIWEGNRARAHKELSISSSLLENNRNLNDIPGSIQLPHCKVNKELTTHKIRHVISLLEVQLLLENDVAELLEEDTSECINLLVPLLLSGKGVYVDFSRITDKDDGFATGELTALSVLVKACEKANPLNIEVYLKSQKRKLQILMVAAGMEDLVASCELFCEKSVPNIIFASGTEPKDDSGRHCFDSVAEQVKEISECVSRVKNCIGQGKDSNDIAVPRSTIADIQTLLLALMCNIAKMCFSKKASGVLSPDQTEQEQRCLFVNASIAFCKLQHLDLTIPSKAQVELIVAIHDVLAEYGLCCFGKNGEGVDGTFLKLAIKHLLGLDMKLKSSCHSLSKETEENLSTSQIKDDSKMSSDGMGMEVCLTDIVVPDSLSPSDSEHEKDPEELPPTKFIDEEEPSKQITNTRTALGEQEREELESGIDDALNQCFFCLYGLNLRSDSTYEDDLSVHQNTSQADYQSKEQCADVFTYILPYAKASTKSGLLKLRKVLRAIHKHFPQPPDDVLAGNPIDKYLDDPTLCEDKLSEKTGSDGYLESIVKVMYPDTGISKQNKISLGSCEPYMDVYSNLYYLLAQSEESSAIDKRPGFVLTKEGEDFMEQSAKLSKFDLLFNPLRFESWQRLANIYDEEVDLLLNDGSKNLNVAGWRKNVSLPQRVEASRRRSRRCLLMSLALAKTPEQQSEIHELLALVYYDSVQNAVPFYDQRSIAPLKDSTWMMFCKNSMKHFEKAFAHRQDWSHAFYLGKLCEKLECPPDVSFSYYSKAIVLNPSSVDAIYRMHASRLKLLYTTSQRKNVETLKVCASYSFDQTTKEPSLTVLDGVQRRQLLKDGGNDMKIHDLGGQNDEQSDHLDNIWHMLYSDCLSGLEICVEGDLKHFHKARYRIAQGLYRRGDIGDLELAKNEISFCFKSSRSSFTINMWEIDSTAKKGRRKIPIVSGSKKLLEVNLPESSRKFITCIRKYLLFYLRLLEETGDICTLDRAYVSIRTDKRFSLCLEDMVPVSLGRYLKALIISLSTRDDVSSTLAKSSQQILEKMFNLFMEQGSIWPDICSSPDIKCPELRESTLYGYLHQYLYSLEKDVKLEVLEGINEKIRKRSKNPKLSNSFCVGIFKHASVAWCRSLIVNLVLVTPLNSSSITDPNADLDNNHLLCIDLQTSEFWNSSFGDASHLSNLETKWDSLLSKVKYVLVKKASEENLDTANSLLRSAYSFYRDSSSIVLTSGINLFWVPSRLATTGQFHPSTDGVEIVDISVPRKLLLWAYTLLHGRCPGISAVVKYCEENFKSKMKKASAGLSSSSASLPTVPAAQSVAAVSKDGILGSYDPAVAGSSSSMPETISIPGLNIAPLTNNSQKILSTDQQLHHCNNAVSEKRTFDLNDDAEPERT
ncbi:calcineurin-binding protein 1 [Silene latifolia]|uniref:calcineurin-binding protein 1 n=1 Tax=Silene latifolia TaxID=37657 RepID=UPI003D7705F4